MRVIRFIFAVLLTFQAFGDVGNKFLDICKTTDGPLDCIERQLSRETTITNQNGIRFEIFLRNADKLNGGIVLEFNQGTYRLDLTISDYIDNLYFKKDIFHHAPFTSSEFLQRIVKDKPIENFPKLLKALEILGRQYPKVRERLNKIDITFYNLNGKALTDSRLDFIKQPFRIRRINKFNRLQNDPEYISILKRFQQKLELPKFLTHHFTITKTENKELKDLFLEARKEFYQKYFILMEAYEGTQNNEFEFEFKQTRNDRVKVNYKKLKGESKEFRLRRRTAEAYFNNIERRTDKRELLVYLNSYLMALEDPIGLPTLNFEDFKPLILPPYFIFKHIDKIKPILREYTYDKLVIYGEEQHVFRIKKWLRKNRQDVEEFQFEFGKTGPRVVDIKKNYLLLVEKFPHRPWETKFDYMKENGDPLVIGGFGRKLKYAAGFPFRYLKAKENIVGAIAGGVLFAVTGNPLVFSPFYTLGKYGFSLQKYDRKLRTLYGPFITDLVAFILPTLGVFDSNLLTLSIYGAITGAAENAFLGHDILSGAITGASFDLFTEIIPYDMIDPELLGGNLFLVTGARGIFDDAEISQPEDINRPRIISVRTANQESLTINQLMNLRVDEVLNRYIPQNED